MRKTRWVAALFGLVLGLSFSGNGRAWAADPLPALSVDPQAITVSGVSSGGFMAVQLQVAHSATFSGVGSVAGGIYWCAEGNVYRSGNPCMSSPWLVNVEARVEKALREAEAGAIDPVTNLSRARVYLFSSPIDPVIHNVSSAKLKEFYEAFLPSSQIRYRRDLATAHGFPTARYGAPCVSGGYPWVLNCGFDLAGELLRQLHGPLHEPTEMDPENLQQFDQTEFTRSFDGMARIGRVYIPSACQRGKTHCKLHVALHGCSQAPAQVGDAFYGRAGYNEWAEANNIIVLYPAVLPTASNPYACWDWYGYTGHDYVVKRGAQISAIKAMIDRLSGLY